MAATNPYVILGIDKTATRDEIDAAFREKAKKYHPDVGGDVWAFRLVQEAYDLLIGQVPNTGAPREPPHTSGRSERDPATTGTRPKDKPSSHSGERPENEHDPTSAHWEQVRPADRQQRKSRPADRENARSSEEVSPEIDDWWKNLLDSARYLVTHYGIHAAIRSKNLNLLDKARCVLFFVVGLVMLSASVYFLWDSYGFLSVYKTTEGSLTANPKLSFSGGGGPLNHTAVPETHVEYSFTVDGCRYDGSDRLSGEEARKFDKELPLAFGKIPLPSFPSRGITVFYDRNNPSRNRASLPEPLWLWFGLAFGLVLCLFPKLWGD